MIFNINDLEISDPNNNYAAFTKDNLICYSGGFFYGGGKRAGKESIELLLNQLMNRDSVNFKDFFGAYRIIIIEKKKNNATSLLTIKEAAVFIMMKISWQIS